ncbi:hypothetical protein GCM10014715_63030 [Streptomyces spiralis]|uniref:Uncharacterized protein n=1 Tax=Streptomyces spiralis TaxID=66376 RepID=A0A919ACT1_9ACTN|nr:hypothetical protein [Streptomyces spiralis]GHE98259.1 hypothetical protein GCM10014715_63030 [Streptomyces spiralis]
MADTERGDADRQGLSYYPWWLDDLADDATLEGGAMNGTAQGAEAVRAIVVKARELYEFQDFSFTGDFGDNGFLEIYESSVQGEPVKVVVTVTRNAEGQAQSLAVLHRPRSSLLLFSRLMHERFAGTPLAEHFLSDES